MGLDSVTVILPQKVTVYQSRGTSLGAGNQVAPGYYPGMPETRTRYPRVVLPIFEALPIDQLRSPRLARVKAPFPPSPQQRRRLLKQMRPVRRKARSGND
jgi:hypothetical protein